MRLTSKVILTALTLLLPHFAVAGTIAFTQTNLTSDLPGVANNTDPNLVNPWGITFNGGSPFWIADNGSGLSTVYDTTGKPFPASGPLVVTIPPPVGGTPPSAPTGIVPGTGFSIAGVPASFLFATEDGTISAWNSGTAAVLEVDNSANAVYKALATGECLGRIHLRH